MRESVAITSKSARITKTEKVWKHQNLTVTNKKLQEKFIVLLDERLKIKKEKKQELETTLVKIRRDSQYAYKNLTDCLDELKDLFRPKLSFD